MRGDYQLDAGSDFLVRAGRIVAEEVSPLSQQQQALKEFAKGGYYSLTMEAPMRSTRLIVVNDLFCPQDTPRVPAHPTPLLPLRKWRGYRNNWHRRGDWV